MVLRCYQLYSLTPDIKMVSGPIIINWLFGSRLSSGCGMHILVFSNALIYYLKLKIAYGGSNDLNVEIVMCTHSK